MTEVDEFFTNIGDRLVGEVFSNYVDVAEYTVDNSECMVMRLLCGTFLSYLDYNILDLGRPQRVIIFAVIMAKLDEVTNLLNIDSSVLPN
jgi:hypothetical protein